MEIKNIVVIFQCGASVIVCFDDKHIADLFPVLNKVSDFDESSLTVKINDKSSISELFEFPKRSIVLFEKFQMYLFYTILGFIYNLKQKAVRDYAYKVFLFSKTKILANVSLSKLHSVTVGEVLDLTDYQHMLWNKNVGIEKFTIGEFLKFNNTNSCGEGTIHTLFKHQPQIESSYNRGYRGEPI